MPSTSPGREVKPAILSISSVEVLEASTAPFLADAVELAEHLLLHADVLKGSLDDEVHVCERTIIHAARNQRHALVHARPVEAAAPHHALVIFRDNAKAAAERSPIALHDRDGDAGIGEGHGDAAAHRSRAHDACGANLARLHVRGKPGDFRHLALGKEHMDQRLALSIHERLAEQLALAHQALAEGQIESVFDRVGAAQRRVLARMALFDPGALFVENGRAALRFDLIHAVAHPRRERQADFRLRESDGGIENVTLHDLVHNAGFLRKRCRHLLAGGDKVEGLLSHR